MVKISSPFALIIWKKKKNMIYFLHSLHSLFLVKKYDTFAFNVTTGLKLVFPKDRYCSVVIKNT